MAKEHFDFVVVISVGLSLIMYDVVIDLSLGVLHLFFVIIHIIYEWFELGIEHGVEHLLQTSRRDSQIITFYILLLIAGLGGYWLWRALPRLYKQFIKYLQRVWTRHKAKCESYWLSLTLIRKIMLVSMTTGFIYVTVAL